MNHVGRTMNPWTGDYVEWKDRYDAYHELLADLWVAQEQERTPSVAHVDAQQPTKASDSSNNDFFPKKPVQSDSSVVNQQRSGDSKVIRSDSEVISDDSKVIPCDSQITSSDSESLQHRAAHADGATDPDRSSAGASPSIDITKYFDRDDVQVALDLQDHLSGRSPLDHVPANHQQAIILLLEDHPAWRVAKVIAQPVPHGLAIQVTAVTLNRFRRRYNAAKDEHLKQQTLKASHELIAQANGSDDTFQAALQRLMKIRLLSVTSNPNACVDQIDSLITSLTKLRKQSLAERKQLHAERLK
jgi:hypothetical protein